MKANLAVKRIVIVIAATFLVGTVTRVTDFGVPSAWAQEECSLGTLQGDYLVTGAVQPRIDQRDDPTLPRITVANWAFDGRGIFTAHAIQNFGGQYREADQGGTYTVTSDTCIAIVTFPPEMGAAVFKGILNRDGREGDLIRMDPDEQGRVVLATRHLKKRSKD